MPLKINPATLARVEGKLITPNGNEVYEVTREGQTYYVTVPPAED